MNNAVLFLLLLIGSLVNSACEQVKTVKTYNPQIIGVQFPDFRGAIFGEGYILGPLLTMDGSYSSRFTPSLDEIKEAERILTSKIDSVVHSRSYLANMAPLITTYLNDYFRQYSGYMNDKGEKLIFFNCLWDKDMGVGPKPKVFDHKVEFSSHYRFVLNGGNYYWQTIINVQTKQVVEFRVNGHAWA